MTSKEPGTNGSHRTPAFRLDVPIHDLLMSSKARSSPLAPAPQRQPPALPEPVFPLRPEARTRRLTAYRMSYCYDNIRVLQWLGRQALRGFRGVTGSF